MSSGKPATVEEYLAGAVPEGVQAYERVVAIVREATGDEPQLRLSYGMPTFFVAGKRLLHVATWGEHLAIYPIPEAPHDPGLPVDLAPHVKGKGTLHFRYADPWPGELITRVVQAHLDRVR